MPVHETNILQSYSADPSIIATSPSDQTLNETNPMTLYCNSTGNPSPNITWVKEGGGTRAFEQGNILQIKQVQKSDEGIYRCTASNGVGKNDTATAMVKVIGKRHAQFVTCHLLVKFTLMRYVHICCIFSVYFAPIINYTQSNVTVNETETAELHCNATGNPKPFIQWWFVKNSVPKHIFDGETLKLRNIHRNDSGLYRCTASNGIGSPAMSYVHLNVQCK